MSNKKRQLASRKLSDVSSDLSNGSEVSGRKKGIADIAGNKESRVAASRFHSMATIASHISGNAIPNKDLISQTMGLIPMASGLSDIFDEDGSF